MLSLADNGHQARDFTESGSRDQRSRKSNDLRLALLSAATSRRLSSHPTMSLLSVSTAASLARQCARPSAVRASAAALQVRNAGSSATTAESYTSPFRGTSNHKDTTHIPDFKKYRNSGGETQNKVFQYFMVGTMGAITALGAKATVQGTPIPINSTSSHSRTGSNTRCRLPRQHVGFRRCLGSGQG
jgi:hypothetical protein